MVFCEHELENGLSMTFLYILNSKIIHWTMWSTKIKKINQWQKGHDSFTVSDLNQVNKRVYWHLIVGVWGLTMTK